MRDEIFLKNFINSVRTWLVGWQAQLLVPVYLTNEVRFMAQRYLLQYQESILYEEWLQHCVISKKLSHSLEGNSLVFCCCTLSRISPMAFSFMRTTLEEIMGMESHINWE